MRFEKAAVIGTGMMGPGIAVTLAFGGVSSVLLSRTEEGARQGLDKARANIDFLLDAGLIDDAKARDARERIRASSDAMAEVAGVDLVIESAPENMAFKKDLFADLERAARPDAVLATNTSGLSITEIASACQRPERVVTTHFWNPPHLMPLVEIVRGEKTSPAIAEALHALLLACGKVPVIVKKDRPGQLGNRLQHALIREAANIVAEGIADAEDVDLAAKMGFGLRLPVYGILEHQDMVGLDMGTAITDYVCADLNNEGRAPEIMHQKVREGNLGVKTGLGFYDWSKRSAPAVRALRDEWLREYLKTPFLKRVLAQS
jgi:3-hydroxybutyryl-CoA dehydrogenase